MQNFYNIFHQPSSKMNNVMLFIFTWWLMENVIKVLHKSQKCIKVKSEKHVEYMWAYTT